MARKLWSLSTVVPTYAVGSVVLLAQLVRCGREVSRWRPRGGG